MVETKTSKLEQRVEFLEKELEGSRNAVRKLFEQQNKFIVDIEELKKKNVDMQITLAQLQNVKNVYENNVHRYE